MPPQPPALPSRYLRQLHRLPLELEAVARKLLCAQSCCHRHPCGVNQTVRRAGHTLWARYGSCARLLQRRTMRPKLLTLRGFELEVASDFEPLSRGLAERLRPPHQRRPTPTNPVSSVTSPRSRNVTNRRCQRPPELLGAKSRQGRSAGTAGGRLVSSSSSSSRRRT